MSTLTVRNLDPEVTTALKVLAISHGRSMEAEARVILASAVHDAEVEQAGGLGSWIRGRFAGLDWDFEAPRIDGPRAAVFDE
jgi:plasmid stability protein